MLKDRASQMFPNYTNNGPKVILPVDCSNWACAKLQGECDKKMMVCGQCKKKGLEFYYCSRYGSLAYSKYNKLLI